jgi:hypothetical protein
MRSSLVKSGMALAGLAVLMGLTNPKQDSYSDYASEKLITGAQKEICQEFKYCESGEPPTLLKNTIIKPAINASTQRQNLVIFSLYTTELPGIKTYKSIGAFGNFMTYSES